MKLIIIRGSGASGKTALARRLAKDMRMQVFYKDAYKEKQFDLLDQSPTLKELLYYEKDSWVHTLNAVKESIARNTDLIIEGNLMAPQKRALSRLFNELYCHVKGLTGFKRYVKRNESGERHKGHRDRIYYPVVLVESLSSYIGYKPYKPFKLSPHFKHINMNDFTKIDYEEIEKFIKTR